MPTTDAYQQIQTFPFLYINGFTTSWTSTTTLTIAPGLARDALDVFDIQSGAPLVLNSAHVGVNGIDTGALANNTWYAIYAIGDYTFYQLTACLLSTSFSNPVMPFGYTSLRRIGYALTDGSAHFVKFYMTGNGSDKYIQWDVPITILSAGSSTTFAPVNGAVGAPPVAQKIFLNTSFTPAATTDVASIRPTGSTAAAGSCPIEIQSNVISVPLRSAMVNVLTGALASIDYEVASGDALTLTIAAYVDSL